MFPEAYQHNQELKVDYRLGVSLTIVLIVFASIVGASMLTFRLAWNNAVGTIRAKSEDWAQGRIAPVNPQEASKSATSGGSAAAGGAAGGKP